MSAFTVVVANNSGAVSVVHVEAATPQAAMALAEKGRGEALFVFGGHISPLEAAA